jgi:uncharacterized protein (DUF697 family)
VAASACRGQVEDLAADGAGQVAQVTVLHHLNVAGGIVTNAAAAAVGVALLLLLLL